MARLLHHPYQAHTTLARPLLLKRRSPVGEKVVGAGVGHPARVAAGAALSCRGPRVAALNTLGAVHLTRERSDPTCFAHQVLVDFAVVRILAALYVTAAALVG